MSIGLGTHPTYPKHRRPAGQYACSDCDPTLSPEPTKEAKERRERIATAVLAGFAACDTQVDGEKAPAVAVVWADLLIAELDR